MVTPAAPVTSEIASDPSLGSIPLDAPEVPPTNYADIYEQVKSKPLIVSSIERVDKKHTQPLRTKEHIIERELKRVYDAKNLEEINEALEESCESLASLGVFSTIDAVITDEPEDSEGECTVLLDIEEKNWYSAKVASYFQGGENTCEATVELRNITGHAESVSTSFEMGTEKSSSFSLTYSQPRPWGRPFRYDIRGLHQSRNNQHYCSHTERFKGISTSIQSDNGGHSLSYDLGWRQIEDTQRTASREVLQQKGDFLKTALRYNWLVDRRKAPGEGWALRSSTELAGIFPRRHHVRQSVDFTYGIPLDFGLSLTLMASGGLMIPMMADRTTTSTSISERFFLGGTTSLRGFGFKGAGPTGTRRPGTPGDGSPGEGPIRRDALGGDLFTSLFAAVNFPLPHPAFQALNIHGHVFVNGGNTVLLSGTKTPLQDQWKQFLNTFRWSAGIGLVLPTWFGRAEANYVQVLSHQEHDRIKQGISFGIAANAFV